MSNQPPPPPPPGSGGSYSPPPGDGGGYTPPPGGGGYGQSAYGGQASGGSKKGTWALILGILGILCCGIFTGIPAIILGRQGQREGAGGTARAGEILGYVSIVFFVLAIILFATGALTFQGSFDAG